MRITGTRLMNFERATVIIKFNEKYNFIVNFSFLK